MATSPMDLFISHSSADVKVARELRAVLESAGYTCWLAPDDVIGTGTWTEQILAAIEACRAAVVLVSSTANRSVHVSREVNLALGRERPVLPIRIEAVAPEGSLEYLLSLVQRVDAFPPPVADHRDQILRRLEAILPREAKDGVAIAGDSEAGRDAAGTQGEPAGAAAEPVAPDLRTTGVGPGTTVGGFVIESVLGEGGMATVYRARQAEPNRVVALKVIRSDHARNPAYRRRFLAEKETLASLEHPSIVPIYAAGDDRGVLYIAMRHIDGLDLGRRIANQGRLGIRETVEILRPIADALDYAHETGVLHRDLKPANILLDRRGVPYLTDFAIGERDETGKPGGVAGIVMGSAEYLAPERATGKPDAELGPAIDIYALGCIAFACLIGRAPFVRDTPEAVLTAHVNDATESLRAIRGDLPKVVDELLARALAKDPAARFATADEFVSGLELVAQAASQGATQPVVLPEKQTPEAKARKWLAANTPLAAIGGALAAIIVVVAVASAIGPGPRPTGTPASTTRTTAPVGDVSPPVGGRISIASLADSTEVTADLSVDVTIETPPVDASRVTSMLASNTSVLPPVSEALPYATTFTWQLDEGDGLAGERTVYVWFGDAAGNWATTPVTSSITFDNPPSLSPNWEYDYERQMWCNSLKNDVEVVFNRGFATDPDGDETVRATRLWTGDPDFDLGTDLSDSLKADGTGAILPISLPNQGFFTVTDYVTIEDEHGLTAEGSFVIKLGCPQ